MSVYKRNVFVSNMFIKTKTCIMKIYIQNSLTLIIMLMSKCVFVF